MRSISLTRPSTPSLPTPPNTPKGGSNGSRPTSTAARARRCWMDSPNARSSGRRANAGGSPPQATTRSASRAPASACSESAASRPNSIRSSPTPKARSLRRRRGTEVRRCRRRSDAGQANALLNALALVLVDGVAGVTRGAGIDGTANDAGGVLCHVRRDVQVATCPDETFLSGVNYPGSGANRKPCKSRFAP